MHRALWVIAASLTLSVCAEDILVPGSRVDGKAALPQRSTVECRHDYTALPGGCRPTRCGRAVLEAVLSGDEAAELRRMTNRAIAWAVRDASPKPLLPSADAWVDGSVPYPRFLDGPTIVDVNTGYVRHSALGLRNLYKPSQAARRPFRLHPGSKSAYQRAGKLLEKLLKEEFGLEQLFFTAPTFVARLQGSDSWTAKDIHDEYWHAHVDKMNTEHYDYSALVYLSEQGSDFEGGEFVFVDDKGATNTTVLPMPGRAVLFTAGQENLHRVMPVTAGVRYAISMWFTCDESRHMSQFLDGSMHQKFATEEDSPDAEHRAHRQRTQRHREIAARRHRKRFEAEKRKHEEL